jgi:hypothetical protein
LIEYQRWGLNVNILKTEYLNVGSDIQSTRWFKYDRDYLCVNKSQFVPVIFEPPCIQLKKNTETEGSRSVEYLGSTFTNSENAIKKCQRELIKPGKQQER